VGYPVFRALIIPIWAWSDIFSHATRGKAARLPVTLCPAVTYCISPTIRRLTVSARTTLTSALMSHSHLASTSSSNFQLIVNNALKAYEKRTKKDLLAHPLASQLQACDTPAAILAVLQQQAQGIDQSRGSDDRWTKWLDPTISVLYTFSATLGAGVGLVCLRMCSYLRTALS
jgi:hypothetical protein